MSDRKDKMELIESFGEVRGSLQSCWPFSCADRRLLATEDTILPLVQVYGSELWGHPGPSQRTVCIPGMFPECFFQQLQLQLSTP